MSGILTMTWWLGRNDLKGYIKMFWFILSDLFSSYLLLSTLKVSDGWESVPQKWPFWPQSVSFTLKYHGNVPYLKWIISVISDWDMLIRQLCAFRKQYFDFIVKFCASGDRRVALDFLFQGTCYNRNYWSLSTPMHMKRCELSAEFYVNKLEV